MTASWQFALRDYTINKSFKGEATIETKKSPKNGILYNNKITKQIGCGGTGEAEWVQLFSSVVYSTALRQDLDKNPIVCCKGIAAHELITPLIER